ncbi:MAG: hypothetical protein HW421_611 [Ignavibacteria bacterium]|nr:hypothetical protein [Ignavibacteria bacterium]
MATKIMKKYFISILLSAASILIFDSCEKERVHFVDVNMYPKAEAYIKLALQLGKFDPNFISHYYGPAYIKRRADAESKSLDEIKKSTDSLIFEMRKYNEKYFNGLWKFRYNMLLKSLYSLKFRTEQLSGTPTNFNEEMTMLFDCSPVIIDEEYFARIHSRLDSIIVGENPVLEKCIEFRNKLIVSPEKVKYFVDKIISEAKIQTIRNLVLPPKEYVKIKYQPYGDNKIDYQYLGNFVSEISINTSSQFYIDELIELICRNTYPGKHVIAMLWEKSFVIDSGWVEFSLLPKYSPLSFLFEGTSSIARKIVLPGKDYSDFFLYSIFPQMGIKDTVIIKTSQKFFEQQNKINIADYYIGRLICDTVISHQTAIDSLAHLKLIEHQNAEKKINRLISQRTYPGGYVMTNAIYLEYLKRLNIGEDMPNALWLEYSKFIFTPLTVSELKGQ